MLPLLSALVVLLLVGFACAQDETDSTPLANTPPAEAQAPTAAPPPPTTPAAAPTRSLADVTAQSDVVTVNRGSETLGSYPACTPSEVSAVDSDCCLLASAVENSWVQCASLQPTEEGRSDVYVQDGVPVSVNG